MAKVNPHTTLEELMEGVSHKRAPRTRQTVPYSQIEPLITLGCKTRTEQELAMEIGYSRNIFIDWDIKKEAPKTAYLALRGLLAQSGVTHSFSLQDLTELIRVAPTPDLVLKIAREINHYNKTMT